MSNSTQYFFACQVFFFCSSLYNFPHLVLIVGFCHSIPILSYCVIPQFCSGFVSESFVLFIKYFFSDGYILYSYNLQLNWTEILLYYVNKFTPWDITNSWKTASEYNFMFSIYISFTVWLLFIFMTGNDS